MVCSWHAHGLVSENDPNFAHIGRLEIWLVEFKKIYIYDAYIMVEVSLSKPHITVN